MAQAQGSSRSPGAGSRGRGRAFRVLIAVANLLAIGALTLGVTAYYDGAHNGRVSGHEELAVAGVWGLYGMGLALAGRRFTHPSLRNWARAVLGLALTYLTVGALPANARWALPGYRLGSYAAVLGGAWVAEWLFEPFAAEDRDVHGILSLVAALGGAFVLNFEVLRWLEPAFTLPAGVLLTPDLVAWQRSTIACLTAATWGAYSAGVGVAGVRFRSWRARLFAGGLAGVTLVYLVVAGAANPAAAAWVRLLGYGAAAGGALLVAGAGRRAPGDCHRLEPILWRTLPWFTAVVVVIWTVLEVF